MQFAAVGGTAMTEFGPKILSVDGIPVFVVLGYDEYQRLLTLAAAPHASPFDTESIATKVCALAPGDDLTTPTTDRAALHLPEEISYPLARADGLIPHEVISSAVHNHWSLVRAWREYLGLTQSTMAQRLAVSVPLYEEMGGEFEPVRSPRRELLAEGLGIQPQQLIARHRRKRRPRRELKDGASLEASP